MSSKRNIVKMMG